MSFRPLACGLLLLALSAPAPAQNHLLQLDSEPGDYVGAGQSLLFTAADGTFSAFASGDGVFVSFQGTGQSWSLSFAPPAGQPFVVGAYAHAQRFPTATVPRLDVGGDGRGCNETSGRFVVLELTKSGTTITGFAADFEQHCEDVQPALFGSIRINSTLPVEPRLAVVGRALLEGDDGLRDATFDVFLTRRVPLGVTVDYRTVPGSAQAGSDYVPAAGALALAPSQLDATVSVFARANRTPQTNRSFALELSNPANASIAVASAEATILDDDAGKTLLYVDSEPFELLMRGARLTLTPADGIFTATLVGNHASFVFDGAERWAIDLASPSGTPFVPGTYEDAGGYPFGPAGLPGLAVTWAHVGCSSDLYGRFVVHELELGPGTSIARFAADLELHCGFGVAALFASLRLSSDVPVPQETHVVGDLDADGATDLVWRNASFGFDVAQLLDGVAHDRFQNLPRVADPNWHIVGTNDFDGNGTTDLLWHNGASGQCFVLFLVGTTPSGIALLPTVPNLDWKIVGTGRFDTDGWPDVLWRNQATGANGIAIMRGTSLRSFQLFEAEADPDWEIAGAADFDRNGRADVLWHNRATLANRVWLMALPNVVLQKVPLLPGPAGWDLVACGDLDRDGESDLVWRNATDGTAIVWFLRERSRAGIGFLEPLTDLDWQIVGPK